jgi:FKBP-type peptidyl-prolyl cis-trans isomerase
MRLTSTSRVAGRPATYFYVNHHPQLGVRGVVRPATGPDSSAQTAADAHPPPLVTSRRAVGTGFLAAVLLSAASSSAFAEEEAVVDAAALEAQAALAAESEALAALTAAGAPPTLSTDATMGIDSASVRARLFPPRTDTVLDGGTTTLLPTSAMADLSPSEKTALAVNRRVQAQNAAPDDGTFPVFVRQGYDIKVLADGFTTDTATGLIFKDLALGDTSAPYPEDGQEVVFDYTAYNESGSRIDSSASKGRPARVRLGIGGLIPGFELGIRSMRPGGARRLVVPPDLGPPVGPQTFFSAKQCEVFDVQLRAVNSCRRRQVAMFSDVVCDE